MSKHINVNPGQYKVAGRERPGEDISPDRQKATAAIKAHELREQGKARKKTRGGKGK